MRNKFMASSRIIQGGGQMRVATNYVRLSVIALVMTAHGVAQADNIFGGSNSIFNNPGQITGGPNSVINNPGQLRVPVANSRS
jgi:hypothetical protein